MLSVLIVDDERAICYLIRKLIHWEELGLIRIFHIILTKGVDYDGERMLRDIIRPEIAVQAA